jgi:hypothetical protein
MKKEGDIMKMRIVLAILISAGLIACMLLPSSGITYYPGAPKFSPTSSGQVAMLREEPQQANVQLGEVWVNPQPGSSLSYVENQLKQQAATLGANAVVVIYDKFSNGQVASGFGQGPKVAPTNGVVGVAVRYQ